MEEKEPKPKRGRPTGGKYEEQIRIDATPEQVARSLFVGRPKSLEAWKREKKIAL